MAPIFIDTHAHIYMDVFEEDIEEMLQRSMEQGVKSIFMPNVDSRTIASMMALESLHPEYCHAMMGLHPCSVQSDTWKKELNIVEDWLSKRPFAAVGEIGMDLYWDTSTEQIQAEAFVIQCQWAKELDLPIVIHSRESLDQLCRLVAEQQDGRLKGVFHCFSGTYDQAQWVLDLGFYIGIGGPLTYKKSELPTVFAQLPLDRIVLETDAPYLPPVPFRGQRNESSYVPLVAQKLAEIQNVSIEEIAKQTSKNALLVYGMGSDLDKFGLV
jgi:TatD DNase family protein